METHISSSMFLGWSRGWSLNGPQEGPTFRELLTGRESMLWRQIKPGDSRRWLINKMAKLRGRDS